MGIRHTSYYIREAFTNMFMNSLMTMASMTTVTCCLGLLGVFLLISFNIDYIAMQVKAQCEIQAYIDISYSEQQAEDVAAMVKGTANVKTAILETRKQAMINYRAMLGEDAVALDGLEDDFLRPSVKITLNDIELLSETMGRLLEIDGVTDVSNRQELIDKIILSTDTLRKGSLYAMFILGVASVFIISNTIKLTVEARAKEIHIMKYVGATNWFIRWPFIIEGLLVGAIGGVVALSLVLFSYDKLVSGMKNFLDIFELRGTSYVMPFLVGLIMIFGSIIGMIGSFVSVRKHLKV